MTEFRRRLRAAGAQYVVVKNTLAQRALAANKISESIGAPHGPDRPGAAGEGSAAAAKVLGDFAKEFQKPTVKIGLVDGKPVEPGYVKRLGRAARRAKSCSASSPEPQWVLYQMVGAARGAPRKAQAEGS